jgi:hypothetical protein
MNRTFVQLAAILALLTFVLRLNANDDPFDTFIFSGLVFIAVIFIILLGFYFMRTGISFMENQHEGETEMDIDDDDESIETEEI